MKPVAKLTISRARALKRNPFDALHNNFMVDLHVLVNLNRILPKSFRDYLEHTTEKTKKAVRSLDEEEKKELRKFVEFGSETGEVEEKSGTRSLDIKNKKVARIIAEEVNMFLVSSRFNMFIREMSLVYLIAEFEQYLGSTLALVFTSKPDIMKSFKKHISYAEIFGLEKVEEIQKKVVEREVNSIISQDIEDVNTYLKDGFKLDLSPTHDWNTFKERFYRRNIVIHSNCYPDEVYKKKTGYKGKNERLSVTRSYLSKSIKLFGAYGKLIRGFFKEKFTA